LNVYERVLSVVFFSYLRSALGQTGTGHFSPIGGYNEEHDLVLIMDVARFKVRVNCSLNHWLIQWSILRTGSRWSCYFRLCFRLIPTRTNHVDILSRLAQC